MLAVVLAAITWFFARRRAAALEAAARMTAPTHVHPEAHAEALLSLDDARAQMLDGLEPLPAEEVALDDALGRVLAELIISRLTLPPWDNSAMDGFAVRAADIAGATPKRQPVLQVTRRGRCRTRC